MLARLNRVEQALAALDEQIDDAMAPWARQLELLQTIPGVGLKTAQVIIAETGADMSRFPSAAHLAAWAGVAPAMHESAGRRSPAGSRKGNKWLASMLVEAANSVSRTKDTYLAARFARIAARRGEKRAAVAIANSILVSVYHMLDRDEPYHDLGPDWFEARHRDAHTRRLVAQLQRLGHVVVLDPGGVIPSQEARVRTGGMSGLRPDAVACPHWGYSRVSADRAEDHLRRAGSAASPWSRQLLRVHPGARRERRVVVPTLVEAGDTRL
jgi:Transposase IS116/IS110/IS902 family